MESFYFKELDESILKQIAKKWVEDYAEDQVKIDRITLHPMGMPVGLHAVLRKAKRPVYAILFHCSECSRDDLMLQATTEEILNRIESGEGFSPYMDLLLATQSRSSDNPLLYSTFPSVYRGITPEKWEQAWRFSMVYRGSVIRADVWEHTGIVLYDITVEQDPSIKTKEDVLEEKQQESVRCSRNEGATWRIQYEAVTETLGTSYSKLPEEIFYIILEQYHADIGMFWELLSRRAKDRYSSIEVAKDFDLYDLAKEAFNENSQYFVALKLADIDHRDFYSSNSKPKRKIIGSILQKIVWRERPDVFAQPEIRNNTQWLFEQFNNHRLYKSP